MSNTTKSAIGKFLLQIHIAQYLDRVEWTVNDIIHPNWFFFWNPAPGALINCGVQQIEIVPDHAYLIPPYTTISAKSVKPFAHLYAHFDAETPFNTAANRIYELDPQPARRFYHEHLQLDNPRRMLYWRIMLMEYLAMLPDEALNVSAAQQDERIRKVLEHFSSCQKVPANTVLARKAGMSVNNFYRRFREVLGISPQRYFAGMRLNTARNMLLNEPLDIEQIARRCGFADRYCFSKSFKQYFGVAPGAFRRCEQEKVSR